MSAIHGMNPSDLDNIIRKIASQYHKPSERYTFDDLVQEGWEACLRASERFDPSQGAKFSTFAWQSIQSAVRDFIMRFHRSGRVVSGRDEIKAWRRGEVQGERFGTEVRIDAQQTEDGRSYAETIGGEGEGAEEELLRAETIRQVRAFGETLTEDRDLALWQNLMADDPLTMAELGAVLGVSKQRVSQLTKQLQERFRRYWVARAA